MKIVKGWAQLEPKGKLVPIEYELSPLNSEEVEIEIDNCGLCHTDLNALNGAFGLPYPIVAGHEITGKIVRIGEVAKKKGCLSVKRSASAGIRKVADIVTHVLMETPTFVLHSRRQF